MIFNIPDFVILQSFAVSQLLKSLSEIDSKNGNANQKQNGAQNNYNHTEWISISSPGKTDKESACKNECTGNPKFSSTSHIR